jgi:CheY-like chemotaxis protein
MKKYKLIAVENDEDEQFFMKQGFDETSLFDVIAQLRNGNAMVDWLDAHPGVLPDVILSDLNMPGMNGFDIIDHVKSDPLLSHIPVIITSTSSTRTIIEKCLAHGAADYVVKPDTFIEYAPFIVKLHELIGQKQLVKG